jgi:hypothetical protein
VPNNAAYWVVRTYAASQNATYTFETVLPVAASGSNGVVLPGARTLAVHAQTGVAAGYCRNDTCPMVFTAQELQQ